MNIFSDISSIVLMILLFGATIFIHELGHFLVALWRKMHVEVFSIGFPPRMFGKKINGIMYQIGWLPLGGYVALPQMDVSSEKPQSSDGTDLKQATPLDKILNGGSRSTDERPARLHHRLRRVQSRNPEAA